MSAHAGTLTDADLRRVLEERAAELARAPREEDGGETVVLLVVAVGDEQYGIDIDHVREITPFQTVAPVPGVPSSWLGLVNLRGGLRPVLDLARFLGHRTDGPAKPGGQVAFVAGTGLTAGLRVDAVREVRSVPVAQIGPSLVDASSDRPHVHAGLTADLLSVLDVEALLGDPSLAVDDAVD